MKTKQKICRDCKGKGVILNTPCKHCNGTGYITVELTNQFNWCEKCSAELNGKPICPKCGWDNKKIRP